VVGALEGAYGVHPGERRNHTKSTCALGSFVGRPEAAAYSRSALFSGQPVPVVARFSLADGDPHASDTNRSPRGMALEFRLPNGSLQHMTMINTPMFFAAMPRTFLDKMLALKPDPATGKPNPEALKAFAESHPDTKGQATFLATNNPPRSYAIVPTTAFRLSSSLTGKSHVGAVALRSPGRRKTTFRAEMTSEPTDFLEKALIDRTQQGPVRWDMFLTIGEPGYPETDPTILWPKDRKELKVGTLTISSAMNQEGAVCENINYDPLVMANGIAATDDPVLLFRSSSYALSFTKRLQEKWV